MSDGLAAYAEVAGQDVIDHLRQLARPLAGARVVHVNSTRLGGGVAEILAKLVPLMQELGLAASWEVIEGDEAFFDCTKRFHNGLQGDSVHLPAALLEAYEQAGERNAERLRPALAGADVVFVHDPQPAPLLRHVPERRGKWIWRCHVDVSRPHRPVWRYLRDFVAPYDASIFSLADFAQPLPHPQYLIPPSIDPLSEKNRELAPADLAAVQESLGLAPERPLILQVSRYDRFKDPVGVIRAFRLARQMVPGLQLALAGGEATDDPEGSAVVREVQEAAGGDPDIHVLLLPADAHRTINALQRLATLVVQKSLREGFGLTVTEALWKGKPVIGGDTGGIRLQVVDHHTGFLVRTAEGAALRIRYLLHNRDKTEAMGRRGREYVRNHFLLTRHLMEYLTLMLGLTRGHHDRIELD